MIDLAYCTFMAILKINFIKKHEDFKEKEIKIQEERLRKLQNLEKSRKSLSNTTETSNRVSSLFKDDEDLQSEIL